MNIIYNAPINSLGYGVAGGNILAELVKDNDVTLFPIGSAEVPEKNIQEAIERARPKLTTDFSVPTVKIWHQHDLIHRPGRGKYYGFPIFELDHFDDAELLNLSCPDELIVCSNWAKSVIERHMTKAVNVVPLGVDTNIFYPGDRENKRTYRFFNIGKWEIRKGHDVLIECFNRAFSYHDDVELHLLCNNPFLNDKKINEWVDLCENCDMPGKIFIHQRRETHEQVADFIRNMDCGVFPSRAEGWNLELLEAMASGKPVIATNYSAHTEFCDEKNSFLVDIEDTEPAFDGIWFNGNKGNWAFIGESQKEQIIEHMRYCFKNKPTNEDGIQTGRQYTWKNSAVKLIESISP